MTLNIEQFSPKRAEITKLITKYKGLEIKGIDDIEGYEVVNNARKDLKKTRVHIQKTGKDMRAEALKIQRDVIKIEKDLVLMLEPTEKELAEKQRVVDEIKEMEKRRESLGDRQEKLVEIGVVVEDDFLLRMDSKEFAEYYNGKRAEHLENKEKELKEKQEKLDAENKKIADEKQQKEAEEKAAKDAKEQAEKKASEEKEESRKESIDQLYASIGMSKVGFQFELNDLRISIDEVYGFSREMLVVSLNTFKTKIEKIKADKIESEKKEAADKAEKEKQDAIKETKRRAEEAKQLLIDEQKKKDQERVDKEKREKEATEKKAAEEKEKQEKLDKEKTYVKFLNDNGCNTETKHQYHIKTKDDGKVRVLYKEVARFNI